MKKIFIILPIISLLILSGCIYKSPTDEDICIIPSVNNPTLTRERGPSFNPKI